MPEPGSADAVVIQQHGVTRFGAFLPGGVVVAAAVLAMVLEPSVASLAVTMVVVLIVAWLTFRSLRAGVVLTDDFLVIRGWLWSRSIPREQIRTVTNLKWVEWVSRRGRRRFSPLMMFWNISRPTRRMIEHHDEAISVVGKWIRGKTVRWPQVPHDPRH